MNYKIFSCLLFSTALFTIGCSKDNLVSGEMSNNEQESSLSTASKQGSVSGAKMGANQVSGIGYFATDAECNSPAMGATFAVRMTGELEGCLYVFVDEYECSPSGTYREVGREYFVGTYNGGSGTFWTTYKFEAKYEGCAIDGSYLGAEILGRCQHPIVDGSGDGIFSGVTGRLDMKDDIDAGNYPYRGHLKY